ncbi:unnamed protein product [Owenia fusiformis]|uniref:HMG domain-containing protein n=1 Tax=Owenia fusiformis TaxID=6347 RepID=A0A8S4NZV8_OWEFU|nr:unnamed protein product [Owenia fusiformis]
MDKFTASEVIRSLGLETSREHDEMVQQERDRADSVRPKKIQRSRTPPPQRTSVQQRQSNTKSNLRTIAVDWSQRKVCNYVEFANFSCREFMEKFSRRVVGGGFRCFLHEVQSKHQFIELLLAKCLEDLDETDMLQHMEEHRVWLMSKEACNNTTDLGVNPSMMSGNKAVKRKLASTEGRPLPRQKKIKVASGDYSGFPTKKRRVVQPPRPNKKHTTGRRTQNMQNSTTEPVTVFPDICSTEQSYQHSLHRVVERRAMRFADGSHWVYCCSCNLDESSIIKNASESQTQEYKDFSCFKCLHISAVERIAVSYDRENAIAVEDGFGCQEKEDSLFEIDWDCSLTGVYASSSNSYGTVGVANKHLCCYTCRSHTTYCSHVDVVRSVDTLPHYLEEILSKQDSGDSKPRSSVLKPLSSQTITLIPSQRHQSLFRNGLDLQMDGDMLQLEPGLETKCPKCQNVGLLGPLKLWKASQRLILCSRILFANVYSRACQICSADVVYDGCEDGLLNMGSFIVTHQKLRSYLSAFEHSKIPLHSFYQTWVADMVSYGYIDFENVFLYNHFRSSWYAFLDLLELDYQEMFSCPKCGDTPNTIVCDGTSLSFRKDLFSWSTLQQNDGNAKKKGSVIQDRVFIDNVKARKLLKMFAQSKSGKQMGEDDYNSMSQILPQCDDHGNDVLLLVQSISSIESRYPPSYYVEFLKTLSSSAPVCATIHPSIELRNLLHQLADGLDVKEDILALTKLQREIPALYTLIIGQPEASIPEAVRPLLRALQYWSEYPFRSCDGVPGSDSIVERELAYFPRNPMVRGRGNYSKDSATKRERCKKMYTGHQSLLPGIFTVLCEHGVCLGYEVMKNHESPNVPFSIFLTRFKTGGTWTILT